MIDDAAIWDNFFVDSKNKTALIDETPRFVTKKSPSLIAAASLIPAARTHELRQPEGAAVGKILVTGMPRKRYNYTLPKKNIPIIQYLVGAPKGWEPLSSVRQYTWPYSHMSVFIRITHKG